MKVSHSQPFFDREDENILLGTLHGKFVSNGKNSEKLGRLAAKVLGKKWGIPTQSGTDALTAALMLTNPAPAKRKVIVPAYICSAPLDAGGIAGFEVVPVDIDKKTLAVSVEKVNALKGVDIVIGAHLFGIAAPFHMIKKKILIEDCAQTLSVGKAGHSGLFSICSFYATKLLTTGHGGLIAGDDPALFERALSLFRHDKNEDWTQHYHFLMSDLNASLGISQFGKLPFFIRERRKTAARYAKALTGSSKIEKDCCYSRFIVFSRKRPTDEIIEMFQAHGVEAKKPVYKPLYEYLGLPGRRFPNAKWVHEHIVSVPLYPGMEEEKIRYVESLLKENRNELSCRTSA